MKTIRRLTILAGLSMAVLALGVTGAKAQQGPSLSVTNLHGTFTLPLDAQWGRMTLPAGTYTFQYGSINGSNYVEVEGATKGSPHGLINVQQPGSTSAEKNAIVCVRAGDALVVRALEMPAIGQAANFAMPRGAQLTAQRRIGSANKLLAEAPMLIQRVPVTLIGR
jgi:hypothetical protein